MTRNWTKTLLPASFKGFRFYVESESVDNGGRQIVTHEYVRGEKHDTEDMGRKAVTFAFKAYLASDAADGAASAFLEILSSKGRGMLVMPVLGLHMAECTEVSKSSEKDKLGYVSFSLKFVKSNAAFAFPLSIGAAYAAYSAAGSLARLITTTLQTGFVAPALAFLAFRAVVTRATEIALAALPIVETLLALSPLEAGASPVDFDARTVRSALARSASLDDLATVIATMTGFVHDHGAVALPDEMQSACLSLASAIRTAVPQTASPGIRDEQRIGARIVQGLSMLFVAEAAAASAARSYAYRGQAAESRAAIITALDTALELGVDAPEEVVASARLAVSEAVRHLDETVSSLAPLVRVEFQKSAPSTAMAWALYKDPARAPELVAAAQTGTSLFMPTSFIAASR